MIESEDKFRFDNMDLGDEVEEAYERKLQDEDLARLENKMFASTRYKKKIEARGVCEGCGEKKEQMRWLEEGDCYGSNGEYVCYECFEHSLECWAGVIVPSRSTDQMEGYMSEGVWDDLWEEENDEGEHSEVLKVLKEFNVLEAFKVFDKQLGI